MGAGIAQVAAIAGRRVLLYDAAYGGRLGRSPAVRDCVGQLAATGVAGMEPDRLDLTAVGLLAGRGTIDRCRIVAPWPSGSLAEADSGSEATSTRSRSAWRGLSRSTQVMQVVMIVGGCHVDGLWAA